MLKIFDFNKNPIGYIWKYKDLKRESELSTGDKTLSFTYLAKTHDIKEEYYIQDKTDEYVVKEVNLSSDGFPQIVAKLNLEELEGNPWEKFQVTDSTIEEAVRLALTGTGWRVGECNVTKRRNAGILNADTLTVIDKLCTVFMCERIYDTKNKTVSFYEKIGEDKGMYFIRGLNLKKISEKSDTYDYYTRIQPVGKDGLTIESVNNGKNYLENYQYSNKVKTYLWIDESYEDPQALKEDAEAKLADMSKPLKSYSADIVDLAKRKPEYSILSFGLGDMVTLIDNGTGIKDEQRIVKLTEYPQDPDKNTCELANASLTFEELQQKLKEAADIINTVVTSDGQFTGTVDIYDILHFEEGVSNSNAVTELRQDYLSISGEMTAVKAIIGQIETNYIKAEEADLKYATIEQLNVTNQTVHTIEGDYADFKVVTANEFASHAGIIDNLQGDLANYKTVVAGELVTAKGWMLEGSIGSAQISDLDVTKLNAGILDTAIINLAGTDGKLQIIDNTIQISDDDRVRVQVGKDASGDYTLAVWDSSGNLIWDALGATENTIQRKIIRDQMVADDANIQGYKLDIESVIPEINGATTKISGTVVQVGNKTLNVALSEYETTITEQGEAISKQAAEIKANQDNIKLKVSTQEFNSYKTTVTGQINTAKTEAVNTAASDATTKANNALSSAKNYTNAQITTVNESLSTTNQEISVMKGQIALKVEQNDIDKAVSNIQIGGRNLAKRTKEFDSVRGTTPFALTNADGYGVRTITDATTSYREIYVPLYTEYGSLDSNITVSFEMKGEKSVLICSFGCFSTATRVKEITNYYVNNTAVFKTETLNNGWVRVTGVFPKSIVTALNGQGAVQYCIQFKKKSSDTTSYTIQIRKIKVECGNKATDWTPAPEDTEESITTISNKQSEILQTMDSITSRVSSVESTQSTQAGNITNLTTRMTSAEQKLTKDGITTIVGDYYALDSDLTDAKSRITNAETTIAQHTNQIALTVKEADVTGDYLVGKINLSSTTAKIAAKNINLEGYVTLTNLSTAGQTSINGANIKTGTISADRIDVNGLFAKDITATGTIRGVNLIGATGSFSGMIKSTNADGTVSTTIENGSISLITGAESYCEISGQGIRFPSARGSSYSYMDIFGQEGIIIREGGLTVNNQIKLTCNGNTVTIGSGNSSWCHFNNSADIPFYFNKKISSAQGFEIYNQNTYLANNGMTCGNYGGGMGCKTTFGDTGIRTLSNGTGLCLYTTKTGSSGWESSIVLADTNGVNLVPKTGGTFTGAVRVNGRLSAGEHILLTSHGKALYGTCSGGSTEWIAGIETRASGTSSAGVNSVRIGQNTLRTYVYTASSVYSNGAWNNFSDRRLKEEFTKLDKRYLDMFDNLNPTLFLWKDKRDTRKQAGYVAQEVLTAMNAAGISESENTIVNKTWEYYDIDNKEAGGMEIYSLEYEGIDTIAVYALQDTRITVKQHGEDIEDLKQKYLELANENILLKAQIEFLQQQIAA